MTTSARTWGFWLVGASSLAIGYAIAFSADCALAQITPDTTLGAESSVITPTNINGISTDQIDGGAIRGANLFHSFREFNVGEGRGAYFTNPTGIEHILSRVTGTNVSNILGTLGVNGGNANLFLINPNGIIFGPNAKLDVAGSFVASTQNSLVFENGSEFSAINPEAPPLLTINLRPGLQYGPNHSGATIANAGNLAVGQDLTLAAGNLDLQGQLHAGGNLTLQALNTLQVRDSAVNPFIASAGGQLVVQGNQGVDIFALNHPESGFFSGGDMVLRSADTVGGDAHYWTGGSFRIEQLDGSLGDLYSPYDPVIRANGDVLLDSYTGASLHILAGGKVEIPGTVFITGPDVPTNSITEIITLSDGTAISIDGSAAPTLDVRAGINWDTPPGNTITGNVSPRPTLSDGTSADIIIGDIFTYSVFGDTGRVFLTNQYQPNTSLIGGITVGSIFPGDVSGGGSVTIDSRGGITLDDTVDVSTVPVFFSGDALQLLRTYLGDLVVLGTSFGDGGEATLLAKGDITLTPDASIRSQGLLGGNITLKSDATISVLGGNITSYSLTDVPGSKGGDINVMARSLSLTGGSLLGASTFGQGNAGSVTIQASDTVSFNGVGNNGSSSAAFSSVEPEALGNGGDINITTGSLSITNGAQLAAFTGGQGDAGSVNINARDTVSFDGVVSNRVSAAASRVEAGAVGNGGNINITTGSLSVTNGAALSASTLGQGNAGSVNINARDTVSFDGVGSNGGSSGAFSRVEAGAVGNGGDINITAGSLSLTNGTELGASTFGQGDAGSVNINARDTVSFDGVGSNRNSSAAFSSVEPKAVGNGGDINITAGSLSVINGAVLVAGTEGQGDAGSVNINTRDTVSFNGVGSNGFSSGAFSTVASAEAVGKGGDINITAGSLSVMNGAELFASTFGQGDSGSVNINARDTVSFNGVGSNGLSSAALSGVGSTAVGKGGDINITAESLSVTNGAFVTASTGEQGDGGNITLNANSLEAANGGQVLTTSRSSGKAGNITVNVTKSVTIAGSDRTYFDRPAPSPQFGEDVVRGAGPASGLFANTASNSTGQGGDVRITTGQLVVQDGAEVTVSSEGSGNAGNLEITARSSHLDNQGKLTAETASGQGGNITLSVQDLLLLRYGSRISTTAGNERNGGDGGNIRLNTPLLVAIPSENSDISANAFTGNGGKVEITSSGIFGIQFREQQTPESDITASSTGGGVNGVVNINTLDVDPSQGLVNLPAELVDASNQIAQSCPSGVRQGESKFVITGRGGLPPSPSVALSSDAIQVDWVTLNPGVENSSSPADSTKPTSPPPAPIVEAQGWIIGANGKVVLTAQAPTATPRSFWQRPTTCHAPENSS